MRKSIVLITCIVLNVILSCASANQNVPYVELVATDYKGKNFTIEVYESDRSENSVDVVFYENSNPSNKVYGKGNFLRGGYCYINTDSPLFDFSFPKGDYKTLQPFKKILYIYNDDESNFVIAPKDTKDPGWRIPYVVHKRNGKLITPVGATTHQADNNPTINISDFLTSDLTLRSVPEIFGSLSSKGFSEISDPTDEVRNFKKGEYSIDYYLEEMEGEKGEDSFNITFPSDEEAKNFVQSATKSGSWTSKTNYFGNTIGWQNKRISINYLDISPESVTITYKR